MSSSQPVQPHHLPLQSSPTQPRLPSLHQLLHSPCRLKPELIIPPVSHPHQLPTFPLQPFHPNPFCVPCQLVRNIYPTWNPTLHPCCSLLGVLPNCPPPTRDHRSLLSPCKPGIISKQGLQGGPLVSMLVETNVRGAFCRKMALTNGLPVGLSGATLLAPRCADWGGVYVDK